MGDPKPTMFIGSSVEGKRIAETIQLLLEYEVHSTVWHQGVFGLSGGTLESLVAAVDDYDFATLVLTPDDLLEKRDVAGRGPRDNVLFELGLFMGALGRKRTFIVHSRTRPILLPTDLAGITPATFEERENLQAALGPVCTKIRLEIEAQKIRPRRTQPTSELVSDSDLETRWSNLLLNGQTSTNSAARYLTPDVLDKLNHDDAVLFQLCLEDICECAGSLVFVGPDYRGAWTTLVDCGLLMQPEQVHLANGGPIELAHGTLTLIIQERSSEAARALRLHPVIGWARLSRSGAHLARVLLQKLGADSRKPNLEFLACLLQSYDRYFHMQVRSETETCSLADFLRRQ